MRVLLVEDEAPLRETLASLAPNEVRPVVG